MNSSQCREQLTALLEAHIARISSANDFLLAIKNAIAANQLENLQQSLANPELALDQIEQLEQQRHQLLSTYGFSENSDGFEKCVAWCDNEQGQVSRLYQQLIQGLLQLQHSIQLNNLLIARGQDRIRRSLGVLTGLGAMGNCKTYSSNGKTLSPAGQRDIAIA
jgi:flagellar biosynthesis/type III secretory pathway chaperone